MSKTKSQFRSRLVRAGVATGAVTALVVAATASSAYAASLPLTLSQAAGPSGGLNTITATAATATTATAPFGAAVTPYVEFQTITSTASGCSATYAAAAAIAVSTATPPVQTAGVIVVPGANVKKLTTTKLAITVPAAVVLTANSATPPATPSSVRYNICVYSGTTPGVGGSPLIANAAYTIAGKPTITSISPGSGPALGGTPVTVVGTGLTGATSATVTIGGVNMTGVTVASDGRSLTGTAPAHAGGQTTVSITSTGGRVVSSDPDNNGLAPLTPTPGDPDDPIYFTYSNGIDVTPTTSPTDRNVDLDIMGVGFLGMDFDNTGATLANADTAHVYLVRGEYDPTDASNLKANGPVVECRSVLVISDTEIICTINLATKLDPADQTTPMTGPNDEVPLGAYTVTVVNNGDIDVQPSGANEDLTNPFVKTDLTSTSTFTVAPY